MPTPDAPTTYDFNPFDPAFQADPFSAYERLREQARVHWVLPGIWLLTRYEDCAALLRDHRVSADPKKSTLFKEFIKFQLGGEESPALTLTDDLLLFMDPPDHERMRSLVNAAFTRRSVEGLRERIRAVIGELLDRAEEKGSVDLMADFAYPLPVTIIAELLGVPVEDRPVFADWTSKLVGLFGSESSDQGAIERGNEAVLEFRDYFTKLGDERRKQPREDLITALIDAEEAGDRLSNDEMLANCMLLLIAGHETTANLIGNGTVALLRNPDELAKLRSDPSLINGAVEELLRYDGPVQATARTTLEEIDIGDTTMPAESRVAVLIGCANRDPDVFDEPGALRVDRSPNTHIGFGTGIHFCLGAPLARLEGREAVSALVSRFPGMALASNDLVWRSAFPLRGLTSLPIEVRA